MKRKCRKLIFQAMSAIWVSRLTYKISICVFFLFHKYPVANSVDFSAEHRKTPGMHCYARIQNGISSHHF